MQQYLVSMAEPAVFLVPIFISPKVFALHTFLARILFVSRFLWPHSRMPYTSCGQDKHFVRKVPALFRVGYLMAGRKDGFFHYTPWCGEGIGGGEMENGIQSDGLTAFPPRCKYTDIGPTRGHYWIFGGTPLVSPLQLNAFPKYTESSCFGWKFSICTRYSSSDTLVILAGMHAETTSLLDFG